MKKLILVYNPISGDATFKYKLDDMIAKFLQRDCIVIPYRTQKENLQPFRQFIRNIEVDGVIIAGGDGTMSSLIEPNSSSSRAPKKLREVVSKCRKSVPRRNCLMV